MIFCTNFWIRQMIKHEIKKVKWHIIWNKIHSQIRVRRASLWWNQSIGDYVQQVHFALTVEKLKQINVWKTFAFKSEIHYANVNQKGSIWFTPKSVKAKVKMSSIFSNNNLIFQSNIESFNFIFFLKKQKCYCTNVHIS